MFSGLDSWGFILFLLRFVYTSPCRKRHVIGFKDFVCSHIHPGCFWAPAEKQPKTKTANAPHWFFCGFLPFKNLTVSPSGLELPKKQCQFLFCIWLLQPPRLFFFKLSSHQPPTQNSSQGTQNFHIMALLRAGATRHHQAFLDPAQVPGTRSVGTDPVARWRVWRGETQQTTKSWRFYVVMHI